MAPVGRPVGGDAPPILTLLDLWDTHRGAFEYDWRQRFGMGLTDIPDRMPWGEAWRLTHVLAADPSSHVAAAIGGWSHPVTREWLALADLIDLYLGAHAKKGHKPKPYPRPWPDKNKKHFGRTTRPQTEVRAALRARARGPAGTVQDARGRYRDRRGRFVTAP